MERYSEYKDSGVRWLGERCHRHQTLVASHSYGWNIAGKTNIPHAVGMG